MSQGLARGAKLPAIDAALEHLEAEASRGGCSGGSGGGSVEWCSLAREIERRVKATKDGARGESSEA